MNGWRWFLVMEVGLGLIGRLWAQGSAPALVRHAPAINGIVDGSVQQMLGEKVVLDGNAEIRGDFLMPGTPTIPS